MGVVRGCGCRSVEFGTSLEPIGLGDLDVVNDGDNGREVCDFIVRSSSPWGLLLLDGDGLLLQFGAGDDLGDGSV